MKYLVVVLMVLFTPPQPLPISQAHGEGQQTSVPGFEMWVECVARGPYPGRADAQLSYRYDGAFSIMAEDSRYYGDIGLDNVQLFPFAIEPGEHHQFTQVSVGAFKVVVWKVVFMDELHVLTIWDDPSVADCAWNEPSPPTPLPQGEGSKDQV